MELVTEVGDQLSGPTVGGKYCLGVGLVGGGKRHLACRVRWSGDGRGPLVSVGRLRSREPRCARHGWCGHRGLVQNDRQARQVTKLGRARPFDRQPWQHAHRLSSTEAPSTRHRGGEGQYPGMVHVIRPRPGWTKSSLAGTATKEREALVRGQVRGHLFRNWTGPSWTISRLTLALAAQAY